MKISFIILVFLSGMISGVVIWEVRDDIYNEAVEDKKELIEPEIADTDKKELIHQEKIKVLDRKVMELTDALNISKAYQAKEHSPIKDNKLKKIRVLTLGMLLDSGIEESIAQEIIRRKDAYDFKQLEIRDRAIREGKSNISAYRRELNELKYDDSSIRNELGDDVFDRYLYAIGRDNRIIVSEIMQSSPASYSGILKGDVIVSYNDKKIYSGYDINKETVKGSRDESVILNVNREGEIFNILVPRGPLGLKLEVNRVKP